MMEAKKLIIYTDGGCRNNQASNKADVIGGWGVWLKYGEKEKELYGGKKGNTTNNEMELTALLMALQSVKNFDLPTEVYIDSEYTINCITKWAAGWERNNWKNSKKQPVANQLLIKAILELYRKFSNIKFFWTKGHDTDPGNIKVDALANRGMDEANGEVM